jgi:hypothetical protein
MGIDTYTLESPKLHVLYLWWRTSTQLPLEGPQGLERPTMQSGAQFSRGNYWHTNSHIKPSLMHNIIIEWSRKIKSAVCLSAHLLCFSFWRENTTDFKSVDMLTNEQICYFFQQIVGLVQNFYVGSPLGNLNPLSSPRMEKLVIQSLVALPKTQNTCSMSPAPLSERG